MPETPQHDKKHQAPPEKLSEQPNVVWAYARIIGAFFVFLYHSLYFPLAASRTTAMFSGIPLEGGAWVLHDITRRILLFLHQAPVDFGRVAVGVFFLMSGYFTHHLITRYHEEKAYILNRFWRFYPTYLVFIHVMALFTWWCHTLWYTPWNASISGHIMMIMGIIEPNPLLYSGNAWTFFYEIQFTLYTLLIFSYFKNKKYHHIMATWCVLWLGLFAASKYNIYHYGDRTAYYFSLIMVGYFMKISSLKARIYTTMNIGLLWLSCTLYGGNVFVWEKIGSCTLSVIIYALCLMRAQKYQTHPLGTMHKKVISWSKYTYAFYLFHCAPTFALTSLAYHRRYHVEEACILSLCVSVFLSYIAYHLVEKKYRIRGKKTLKNLS